MTTLHILGAGAFAFEVALVCERMLAAGDAPFDTYDFISDDDSYAAERDVAHRVTTPLDENAVEPDALYVCAIGDPAGRRAVTERFERNGARFATLIDPSAVVAPDAEIGEGTIICAHTFVSCYVKIGRHVHINVMSSLGHDVVTGNCVTISAHVDLTGGVRVGDTVFFGTHAAVLPKKTVGNGSRIGAGCVVVRSIGEDAVLFDDPPKFLRRGRAKT